MSKRDDFDGAPSQWRSHLCWSERFSAVSTGCKGSKVVPFGQNPGLRAFLTFAGSGRRAPIRQTTSILLRRWRSFHRGVSALPPNLPAPAPRGRPPETRGRTVSLDHCAPGGRPHAPQCVLGPPAGRERARSPRPWRRPVALQSISAGRGLVAPTTWATSRPWARTPSMRSPFLTSSALVMTLPPGVRRIV